MIFLSIVLVIKLTMKTVTIIKNIVAYRIDDSIVEIKKLN